MQLRDYQIKIAKEAYGLLSQFGIAYLCMQVRTGKTLTAFETARLYGAKKVLFVTKLKAISGIKKDFDAIEKKFDLYIINYESLHKCEADFDFVILDECHSCFSAGTKVDGKNIENINLGDTLNTFNFTKGIIEKKRVVNIVREKKPSTLVKLKINGKEITCTPNHLFYTKTGWKEAGRLTTNDSLFIM